MDSMKTGQLIAQLRKEKNWTQSDLAEKIGVTDKAVSRWETGRGFPDVALLKPLSDALGVTVNELIVGELVEPDRHQAAADETIVQLLAYSRQEIRRMFTRILLIAGIVILAGSFLFLGVDTSWVSVYSTLGALLIAAALFRLNRKPLAKVAAALAVLVIAFAAFEARDYVAVTQHRLPPLYNISIHTSFNPSTGEPVVRYNKLLYDVYRYNVDQRDEFYVIRSNSVNPGQFVR